MVIVGDAIDGFGDSLAVGVVGVGNAGSIFFHAHKLPPVLPCISPCAVCERIANGVVGDGSAVVSRQQILPLAVAVGVGTKCLVAFVTMIVVYIPSCCEISSAVIAICVEISCLEILDTLQPAEVVVGVNVLIAVVEVRGDVASPVVLIGIVIYPVVPSCHLCAGGGIAGRGVGNTGVYHDDVSVFNGDPRHASVGIVGIAGTDIANGGLCQPIVLVVGVLGGIGVSIQRLGLSVWVCEERLFSSSYPHCTALLHPIKVYHICIAFVNQNNAHGGIDDGKEFYRCSQYKENRGACTIHFIRDSVLKELVLDTIRKVAKYVQEFEPVFLYLFAKQNTLGRETAIRNMKQNIEKSKRRIKELDMLIERIYEDNVLGKISDERFYRMSANYEKEQKELLAAVEHDEQAVRKAEQEKIDLKVFLEAIRECTDLKELTPTIVNTLIKRIDVHNSEKGEDGLKHVPIDISFTAVGIINIPTEKELIAAMEKIREKPVKSA